MALTLHDAKVGGLLGQAEGMACRRDDARIDFDHREAR